jgi:succinate-semialdehyde dehydrogenase/glutarate-semialdehyde dehydrogenase
METIAIVDPLTGSKLHEIQSHSATDVALMFQEGREAQPAWNELGAKARAQIAHKLVDVVIKHQEELMDILQRETGKSRMHAFEEVTGALAAISYYAKASQAEESQRRSATSNYRLHRAYSSWSRRNCHAMELSTCSNNDGSYTGSTCR